MTDDLVKQLREHAMHTESVAPYKLSALLSKAARALEAADRLSAQGEPVAVKPLEWQELTSPREDGPAEPTGDWEAASMLGAYYVNLFEDHYEVGDPEGKVVESWCGGADEAKAAAQADYEQRIRSALVEVPQASIAPEGWHDISTAPAACHVMAARWYEAEWLYGVVLSPPGKPWTHWRPLPTPPSASLATGANAALSQTKEGENG